MVILKTTNGWIKGHSRQPGILRRAKEVFFGRLEMRETQISAGSMSVINIKNGLLYDFNEFVLLTPPFVGGVFLLERNDLCFWFSCF